MKTSYRRDWRDPPRVVTCALGKCGAPVRRGQLFCRNHWFALPGEMRRSILITFSHRLERDYGALFQKAVLLLEKQESGQ